MPRNDIGSQGEEWGLNTYNHSRLLAEIPGLQSRLRDTLDHAAEQAGSDVAQWQATHGERMTAALARTQGVAQELQAINRDALRDDRNYNTSSYLEQELMESEGRAGNYEEAADHSRKMKTYRALQERASRINNDDAHEALQDLRSTLAHADHVIADAHARLSEALRTDQPETRPGAPSPEPLATQLSTLREEIGALRAQLDLTDSPTHARPDDLPRLPLRGPGDRDPEPFGWSERALEECSELFRLKDQESDGSIGQQRIALLQDALYNPQIKGQTLFAKIRNLSFQEEEYSGRRDPVWVQAHGAQDDENVHENYLTWRQVRRRMAQLDFALHASDAQIGDPPVTFSGWRNNSS